MADLATKEGRDELRKDLLALRDDIGSPWDSYQEDLLRALGLLDQWDEQLQAHQAQAVQQPSPPTWLDAPDGPGWWLLWDGETVEPRRVFEGPKVQVEGGALLDMSYWDGCKWQGPITWTAPPED